MSAAAHGARSVGAVRAAAVALLLYLLCAWPVLYIGAANSVGPHVPLLAPALLLTMALVGVDRARQRERRVEGNAAVVWAVVLYLWVTLVIVLAADVRNAAPTVYGNFLSAHIANGAALLVAGIYLPFVTSAFGSLWGRRLVYAAVGALGLVIFLSTWLNLHGGVVPWYLLGIQRPSFVFGVDFNYLFVSDYAALAALLLLSQIRSLWMKVGVTLAGLIGLYWTSSRSAFGCFAMVAAMVLVVRWIRLRFWPRMLSLVAIVGGAVGLLLALSPFLAVLPVQDPVVARFDVTNIESDPSLVGREELMAEGLVRLKRDWVLGHFMGELLEGREGDYMHNWLSFWQAYGLGPFVLFVLLYAVLLTRITVAYSRQPARHDLELGFCMAWFVALSIVVARSYGVNYVWLVLSGVPAILTAARRRAGKADALGAETSRALQEPGALGVEGVR